MEKKKEKRNFEKWLSTFRDSIATYGYYVDFEKIYENVDTIKVPLNILNSLIGEPDIKEKFEKLIAKYPETLQCIPILLAVRSMKIFAMDENGSISYQFDINTLPVEQYSVFMEKTGLFELLQNKIISDLVDYVTGVETGLDSNGRKNRGGHLMENLVEKFIENAKYKKDSTYFKEMDINRIQEKFDIDLSAISNDGNVEKRFDFVLKAKNNIYLIETNFYTSNGSKLNETARSYKMLAQEIEDIPNVKFVWFTDGCGWKAAKNNLKETFDTLDTIFNIKDLENGIIKTFQ